MHFLLAYASRSRPELFKKRVENWMSKASGKHKITWTCAFDIDDATMTTLDIQAFCLKHGIRFHYGASKTKVEAINATMEGAPQDADIIIILSDDMAARMQSWDEVVANDMQTNFPDLDGSLWYSDGRQDNICTLSIMGKAVYSILGHLYHPDFLSVYCDNFYHDLMVRSNRMWKSKQPVFHHEWGHENKDDLMRRNENRELYAKDKATYERLLRETYGS